MVDQSAKISPETPKVILWSFLLESCFVKEVVPYKNNTQHIRMIVRNANFLSANQA